MIAHLAQGASVAAAARAVGIHRTTIHHWQRTSEEFNTALEQARSEYAETLNDEMHDLAAESVRTLRDLLTNLNTPPAVRLRTALAILERPHFPHPGWHLPAEIHPQHERQFLDRMAAVDADYNILRKSRSLSESAPVHQDSSQSALAELMSLMNAGTPSAMASEAPVRHNSSLPALVANAGVSHATRPHTPQSTRHKRERSELIHQDSSQSALAELMSLMNDDTSPAMAHAAQPARNSLCPCGSGKKYKRCCGQFAPPVLSAAVA